MALYRVRLASPPGPMRLLNSENVETVLSGRFGASEPKGFDRIPIALGHRDRVRGIVIQARALANALKLLQGNGPPFPALEALKSCRYGESGFEPPFTFHLGSAPRLRRKLYLVVFSLKAFSNKGTRQVSSNPRRRLPGHRLHIAVASCNDKVVFGYYRSKGRGQSRCSSAHSRANTACSKVARFGRPPCSIKRAILTKLSAARLQAAAPVPSLLYWRGPPYETTCSAPSTRTLWEIALVSKSIMSSEDDRDVPPPAVSDNAAPCHTTGITRERPRGVPIPAEGRPCRSWQLS